MKVTQHADPPQSAAAPRPSCTRVAIYVDANGFTVDVALPAHVEPKPVIRQRRRDWQLQTTVDLLPGETIEQAIEREIDEARAKSLVLIDEIIGALR